MSDDLISRQAAIDALAIGEELLKCALDQMYVVGNDREKYEFSLGLIQSCIADMKELPSAQPERKHGKWIEYVNSHCECPFCHKEWSFFENMTEWFNFCPNCGSEMKGEDDAEK